MDVEIFSSIMYNDLSGPLTAEFMKKHKNLEQFWASGVSGVDADAFKENKLLTSVSLVKSNLGTIPVDLLQGTNVNAFDISESNFTMPDGPIMESPTMQFFKIRDAHLSAISGKALSKFPELMDLQLQGNDLNSLPAELFLHNKKLMMINLRNNKFTEGIDTAFIDLPEKTTLVLNNNDFDCTKSSTREMVKVLKEKDADYDGTCAKPYKEDLSDYQFK